MTSAIFLPLLVLHIVAGVTALIAALVAMASPKRGGALHARAGNWFVAAMAAMASSAVLLTSQEPDRLSLGAGLWTLHLLFSARDAAMQRTGRPGKNTVWSMAPGLAALALLLHGAFAASQATDGQFQGSETTGFLVFGSLCAMSLLGDLLALLRRTEMPARTRISRHLWRMCLATFLAVTSLFLGQQDDVFPFMKGSPLLLLPSLLTLGFLQYWILRVRFARNWVAPLFAKRPAAGSNSLPQKDSA